MTWTAGPGARTLDDRDRPPGRGPRFDGRRGAIMGSWLRRLRGAIGMGVTWAVGWALFGVTIGVLSILTPWLPWGLFFAVFDAPLPALAVPGFVGGTIFSLVLGVAGRRRRSCRHSRWRSRPG